MARTKRTSRSSPSPPSRTRTRRLLAECPPPPPARVRPNVNEDKTAAAAIATASDPSPSSAPTGGGWDDRDDDDDDDDDYYDDDDGGGDASPRPPLSRARDAVDSLFHRSPPPRWEPKRGGRPRDDEAHDDEDEEEEDGFFVRVPPGGEEERGDSDDRDGSDGGGGGGRVAHAGEPPGGGLGRRVGDMWAWYESKDEEEGPTSPPTPKRFVLSELTRETLVFPFQTLVLEIDLGGGDGRRRRRRRVVGYDAALDALGLYEREVVTAEERDSLIGENWGSYYRGWFTAVRVGPRHVPAGSKLFCSTLPGSSEEEVGTGAESLHVVIPAEWSMFVPSLEYMGGMVWFIRRRRTSEAPNSEGGGPPPLFLRQPDVLLGVLSYLAPHEIFYVKVTCKDALGVFESHEAAVFEVRLRSVFSYFSILEHVALQVERVIEGGWGSYADFLTHVAIRLDLIYHDFVPPLLHRALLGELMLLDILSSSINGLNLFLPPFFRWVTGNDDPESFTFSAEEGFPGQDFEKVIPTFQKTQSDLRVILQHIGTDEEVNEGPPPHEAGVREKLREHARALAKVTDPRQLNPFERERTEAGLSAQVWMFDYCDTENHYYAGLGIGPNMEEVIHQVQPSEDAFYIGGDDDLTVFSTTLPGWRGDVPNEKRGLVYTFVNYPMGQQSDRYYASLVEDQKLEDNRAIPRAIWCKAHGIAPFDGGHDDTDWEKLIPTPREIVHAQQQGFPIDEDRVCAWDSRYLLGAKRADAADFLEQK